MQLQKNVSQASLEKVASYARRMFREGLVLDFEGNVSLRLPRYKLIAITPSQHSKSQLTSSQILLTDFQGRVVQGRGKPSSEIRMHIAIYEARKEVNAILHTHSTYASSLAASHKQLPIILDEEQHFLRGAVKCTEYAPAGSSQLAKSAVESLGDRMAVLLANHGALSCGATLEESFRNALLLEHTAKIYFLSKLIGGPVILPSKNRAG